MLVQPKPAGSSSWGHTVRLLLQNNRCRSLLAAIVALVILSRLWAYGWLNDLESYRSSKTYESPSQDEVEIPSPTHPTPVEHDEPITVTATVTSTPTAWEPHGPKSHSHNLISPKIWQIMLPKKKDAGAKNQIIDPALLEDSNSWLAMNPDYTYTLVGERAERSFFDHYMRDRPDLLELYNKLPNIGMKSDLLRYLILHREGGVYTDTDTVALKPIDRWVPKQYRDKVRLIVGIEFDRRDGGSWADIPHWLQFCQWTIAAAPDHPVFTHMIDRVAQSVAEMTVKYGVPVEKLRPSSFEVMNSTGPAAWTDVVFAELQKYNSSLQTTHDLSFMTEPVLYGDILVLTIDGFGMGQVHSHSTNDGTIPEAALMKHMFHGSWRDDDTEVNRHHDDDDDDDDDDDEWDEVSKEDGNIDPIVAAPVGQPTEPGQSVKDAFTAAGENIGGN